MPSYFPNMHRLECSNARKIEDIASAEARKVEGEMLVIMDELQKIRSNMIFLMQVFIVLFPGFGQMNLMTWGMV